MKNWKKITLILCAAVFALTAVRLLANTVVAGAVTRFSGIAVDNTNGTVNGSNIYGVYIGTVAFAGDTAKTVVLTGASNSAKLFASKGTSTDATYVKTITISSGTATVTMSGATTGTVPVMAIDSGSPTF